MTRRELLAASAAAAGLHAQEQPDWVGQVIARYDNGVEGMLKRQITDPKHRFRGLIPDEYGLNYVATAGGIFDSCVSMFLQPRSKFHKNPMLLERAKLAADLLTREQSPEGFIDNPITNFNSPADTAFTVRGLCPSVLLARRAGNREIPAMIDPFLRKAADGLAKGGIAAVGQLQLLQPFFGLALAATLLEEPVTPAMMGVTVAVIGCVAGARRFAR